MITEAEPEADAATVGSFSMVSSVMPSEVGILPGALFVVALFLVGWC